MLEKLRTSAKVPYTPSVCEVCRQVVQAQRTSSILHDKEVRCGSLSLNHPELVKKHPTHRALWDGVVRVGSKCLNHPDLVHKHPTHSASSLVVCFL